MVDSLYHLITLLFFDIIQLYLISDYLSLGISLSCSFVTVSELFCCEFCETFVILSAILLPIRLPVASAVF